MSSPNAYESLLAELRQIAVLESIASVLGWDERTQLPPKAGPWRAEQSASLAGMIHARATDPRIGQWLGEIEGSSLVSDPVCDASVNVREVRRSYDRASKLPASLVEELTRTAVLGEQAWEQAKKNSDYAAFKPWLDKTLELKRRQAECYGYADKPYDALLDDFEPGTTSAEVERVFGGLRPRLVELIGEFAAQNRPDPTGVLHRTFAVDRQEKLARLAAEGVGYDFSAGRLERSVHPFSTELGPRDARITTRYNERNLADSFFSTLHEVGHALYSQGLPEEHYGTPRGQYVSLGIHESQSRMWENLVGRSRSFWTFFYPRAQEIFADVLGDVPLDAFVAAVNHVSPSLIRTESDEATYNLHVMLRFDLERAMLHGDLSTADLPAAWNQQMKSDLGVDVPDDAHGCLQDVHWSGGGIGYFPTYTLGNLYAAQFFEKAGKDLGDLDAMFAAGEFAPLLGWLRTNIHQRGRTYHADDLCRTVTGQPLSPEPLIRRLKGKLEV